MPDEPENTDPPAADTGTDTTDWRAEAEKWKAHSRKHEQTAKANADAAKRLADMEESQKTEIEKAADRAVAAERVASDAQRELLRFQVAIRKGLTEAQMKRLQGDTVEDLEKDADELLAMFGQQPPAGVAPPPSGPKEQLRPGATPRTPAADTDPHRAINDRIRAAARR